MPRRIWYGALAQSLVLLFLVTTTPPVTAQSSPSYVYYTVQPGDRLASIARSYCTSWQAIYDLNASVIGPDPDKIYPGMVLLVPNNCGGTSNGCAGVYDRGTLPHAQGSVSGDRYYVIYGDTWYSISKRFGASIDSLQRANGIYYLYAGAVIVIPCLGASPTHIPSPYLIITSPPNNAVLPDAFAVSGTGGGLFASPILVRALAEGGAVLAEQTTTLQGPEAASGGDGTWTVQLTVSAAPGTPGSIEASAPGTSAFFSVNVFYGETSSNVVYAPGQCQIQVEAGAPAYDAPAGNDIATFVVSATLEAKERQSLDSGDWYRIEVLIDSAAQSLWLSAGNLLSIGGGCS